MKYYHEIDFQYKYFKPSNLLIFITKKEAKESAKKYGYLQSDACRASTNWQRFWVLKNFYDELACEGGERIKLKKKIKNPSREQLITCCREVGDIDIFLAKASIVGEVERLKVKAYLRFDKPEKYLSEETWEKLRNIE